MDDNTYCVCVWSGPVQCMPPETRMFARNEIKMMRCDVHIVDWPRHSAFVCIYMYRAWARLYCRWHSLPLR